LDPDPAKYDGDPCGSGSETFHLSVHLCLKPRQAFLYTVFLNEKQRLQGEEEERKLAVIIRVIILSFPHNSCAVYLNTTLNTYIGTYNMVSPELNICRLV
jgi:hypothetical protein